MKRIAVLAAIGLLAVAVCGFALKGTPDLAVGAAVTTINFGGVGAMLTLHVPGVPLYFGLGSAAQAESLSVKWPTGKQQVVRGPLRSGSTVVIREE